MATTIVSGNLADIQGVTWINAPIEITFVPNPSKPGPVIWADGPFNPGPILIFSDASGNFSIPLPSTDTIQPSNSTWLFSIGPNASAQAVLLNIGVTGTTMNISTLFTQRSNALIIQSLRVPRAYATFELETPVNEGQLWWNTTLGVFQFWNGSAWDSIVGTIPPPVGNVIVPNPTGSQSITQPPGTDFTIATSGGGIFAVNGDMSVNGQLTVENSIKAYGSEGIDLTANHIKIGTGLGDGNPLITIVQAGGAVNEKLWLIAANLNQLYATCTSDGGQDHAWLLVTRVGIDVVDIEFTSAVIGMSGDLNVAGTITAANASFTTAEVDGSEVVTFANIPGGTFVYPEPGIAVSDGSTWLPSINPATVAYVNVSNTFLADQLIAGSLTISVGSIIIEDNFSRQAIVLDDAGDATFNGTVTAGVQLIAGDVNSTRARISVFGSASFFDAYGEDSATNGAISFRSVTSAGTNLINLLMIDGIGDATFNGLIKTFAVVAPSGNIEIDPVGTGNLLLNWSGGSTGSVIFGNGASAQVASVDNAGNAAFNGLVTANSSLFAGANILQVTALSTYTPIPLLGYNTCLWCARDNTLGGSAVIVLDPNAGPVELSNQITGLIPPQFLSGPNTWNIQLTSGPVPRNIAWVALIF